MSGIGIIIILLQTLPFMGTPVAEGPVASIRGWADGIADFNASAFAIAAVTLAVGVLWPGPLRRYIPPTLAALVVGTMMGVLWLTDVPVIGNVPTGLPAPQLPDLSLGILGQAITPALTLAMLGSIDSLLTALIADSMTRTQHRANRELMGQGIGNMAAGFLGGLPGAGATMGTVINIRAGGRTPISGVICAGILLALVLGLARYVEVIPHACLAGILLKVGWDIIDWRFLTRIMRVQREHLAVMVITLLLTVFVDLVTAVAVGLIAAGMATSRRFERLQMDNVVSVPILDEVFFRGDYKLDADDHSAHVGMVILRGVFTVASSHKLISTISRDIAEHDVVIFDFTNTAYMDDSASLVVEELIDTAITENTQCVVMGLTDQPAITLRALNALQQIPENHFADDIDGAREIAGRLLGLDRAETV